MADVKPFRGIRYDLNRIKNLSDVISPPYDVISPSMQEALYKRHPRNIVRIDFGKKEEGDTPGSDVYSRASSQFCDWRLEGTLMQDDAPSLYYYEQEFVISGDRKYVRKGFLGALTLSPFGEGEVYPHERTLSGPKLDRLFLMRATDAHMSPIFGLYSDSSNMVLESLRQAMSPAPDMEAIDDTGVTHRVWKVSDAEAIRGAVENMAGKGVFIADGHHRYETALAFRDEMRARHGADPEAAYEHVLTFLCNMDDEGIVILPTHRGIHSLPDFSEEKFLSSVRECLPVDSRKGSPEDAIRAVEEAGKSGKAVAWTAGGDRYHVISFPELDRFCESRLCNFPLQLRSLDVVLLHGFLIEQQLGVSADDVTAGKFVKYYKDPAEAARDLRSGAIQAAFFLNAVTMREFQDVSLSGHLLPQKSTFFHPKIGTGLLMFSVGPNDKVG